VAVAVVISSVGAEGGREEGEEGERQPLLSGYVRSKEEGREGGREGIRGYK